MKKNITRLLILAFLFFVTGKISATIVKQNDSLPNKPWKISKQLFLDRYGKDDTSRAIINYYFEQQENKGKKKIWVNSLISAISFTLFPIITTNGAAGTLIIAWPFIIAGLIFGVFGFRNAINMIYFSKKNLYKGLKKYFETKKIPHLLRRYIYHKK